MRCRRYFFIRRGRFSLVTAALGSLVLLFAAYLYSRDSPDNDNLHSFENHQRVSQFHQVLHRHFVLTDGEWRLNKTFSAASLDTDLNCSIFRSISNKRFIATGWTKETYKGKFNNVTVAFKFVNPYGHQIKTCLSEGASSFYDCYLEAASKLLLEILRLKSLVHPNVIKVLGYCIPVNPSIADIDTTVGIMEEYGDPINIIRLLRMSWPARLKVSMGLTKLLSYLSFSSLGPVALNDFRRQQFVILDGEIKLVDIDYIGTSNPSCDRNECCLPLPAQNVCMPCIKGSCHNYNEKLNVINAGRHFIKHILPYDVPQELVTLTNSVVEAFLNSSWNVSKILKEMERLVFINERTIEIDPPYS